MLASKLFLPTLKEDPSGAQLVSHRLMLRAGMIRPLASGLYSWLPLGLRVQRRVAQVVREEMNAIDGEEMMMPCIQPAELWQASGRWQDYGPELLRLRDRHDRSFCLGPTHEEVITELLRNEIKSYRQLPLTLYQIHTKFRDEIRPRFGVMRCREFMMKDAYSFHITDTSLEETYQKMRQAYINIFTRLGVSFKAVSADTGSIGGSKSEEFHVLANSGEEAIAFSDQSDYAANVELVPVAPPKGEPPKPQQEMKLIETPGLYTIAALEEKMGLNAANGVKTLIARGKDWSAAKPHLIALFVRGDRELNIAKAEKLPELLKPFTMATRAEITKALGCPPGSLGPVNLPLTCIADHELKHSGDFACGANIQDKHYVGVNWGRDCPLPRFSDLRNITAGEPSPDGKGRVQIKRGIEVGHIFQLGTKYSDAMDTRVLDEQGKRIVVKMGCYGIGVDRVVAACIEQNHDAKGIIWPQAAAPFDLALIPLTETQDQCAAIYRALLAKGVQAVYDDRKMRAGEKFAEWDLIGIPMRLVISNRSLADKAAEFKARADTEAKLVPIEQIASFIWDQLRAGKQDG